MIIVEGPDLVGKTTLCHKLTEYLDTHVYQHLSKPPLNFHPAIGYMDLASRFSVRDRFHISEAIYSEVDCRDTLVTPASVRLVDAHLRLLGTFTVIVTAEPEIIKDRYIEREKAEMYNLETILKVNEQFMLLAKSGGVWKDFVFDMDLHLDCTDEFPYTDNGVDYIINEYKKRQQSLEELL